ncbi:MAG: 3D domain-containing protein, partial [Planctomycetota bacterium]
QDRGAAIRAPGRCDIYMGVGEEAGKLAGYTYNEGRLYYLFVKDGVADMERVPEPQEPQDEDGGGDPSFGRTR